MNAHEILQDDEIADLQLFDFRYPDVEYFVNDSTGSDTNDGLSAATPFKTIQHAFDLIPKFTTGTQYLINIANGTYNENLGLSVNGSVIFIYGEDSTATIVQGTTPLGLSGINGICRVENIAFRETGEGLVAIVCSGAGTFTFGNVKIGGVAGTTDTAGISAGDGAVVHLYNVTDLDADKVNVGITGSDADASYFINDDVSFGIAFRDDARFIITLPSEEDGSIFPITDDTGYLGKNSLVTPKAWKGVVLKDTTNGNYYRIEVINGTITPTLLA